MHLLGVLGARCFERSTGRKSGCHDQGEYLTDNRICKEIKDLALTFSIFDIQGGLFDEIQGMRKSVGPDTDYERGIWQAIGKATFNIFFG